MHAPALKGSSRCPATGLVTSTDNVVTKAIGAGRQAAALMAKAAAGAGSVPLEFHKRANLDAERLELLAAAELR